MRVFVIFAVLIGSGYSQAQDLRAEFKAMNVYLGTLDNYRMMVSYSAAEGTDLEEKGEVSVFVSGDGLFYNIGESSSVVINNDHILLIDDLEHSIVYSENKKVKKRDAVSISDYMLANVDSLIEHIDSLSYYETNGQRTYNLRFDQGYFNLVQFHFKGKVLRKVDYFYNDEYVELEGLTSTCVVNIDENIDFDTNYLSTPFYMEERGEMMVPSPNFNNYLIIYNESLESYIN